MNLAKLWKVAKVAAKVAAAVPVIVEAVKPIVAKKKRQVEREDAAGA